MGTDDRHYANTYQQGPSAADKARFAAADARDTVDQKVGEAKDAMQDATVEQAQQAKDNVQQVHEEQKNSF